MNQPAPLDQADAVRAVLDAIPAKSAGVFANGYISRTGHSVRTCPGDFYMLGSMGLAAGIGLGIATACPDRPVTVIDGDGNLLMGLSVMPLIGHYAPRMFLHVVLDNGRYESTGGQPTISGAVDWPAMAVACGYHRAAEAGCLDAVREVAARAHREAAGPVLIHVPVTAIGDQVPPRVVFTPGEISERVAEFLMPRSGR